MCKKINAQKLNSVGNLRNISQQEGLNNQAKGMETTTKDPEVAGATTSEKAQQFEDLDSSAEVQAVVSNIPSSSAMETMGSRKLATSRRDHTRNRTRSGKRVDRNDCVDSSSDYETGSE